MDSYSATTLASRIDKNESEIEQLSVTLAQRTKRIEELEKEVRLLRSDLKYVQTYIPAFDKEPVPTDKFGKPEGGLEKGDVISYWADKKDNRKIKGLFSRCERVGGEMWVFAYFDLDPTLTPMPLSEVTFEFRPQFPDQKER